MAGITRQDIFRQTLIPAGICAVLGAVISLARHQGLANALHAQASTGEQAGLGLVAGAVAGAIASLVLLRTPALAQGRALIAGVIQQAHPSNGDLLLVSAAAGFGEELFFRGALQPAIGMVPSGLLFVAVHYWVPLQGTGRAIYGIFVVLMSFGLALLYARAGLISAMTAHATIDAVLLLVARRTLRE